MSEIICQWLNEELGLSKRVDPKCFAKEFATGYLIGEVLHKYQLQNDFDQFSQNRAAISKLNNFTRIEPTLQLLGVPFDQNVAQSIMSEHHGAATRLLYQMYIALQKKKKTGLTGVAMETMRPAAPAKLQSMGSEMYRERLKSIVPRQSDISLQQVTEQFNLKSKEMNEKIAQIQSEELQKIQKIQEELRLQDIEKLRRARRRQNEIMARIQAAIVQIPKPPQNRSVKAIEAQKMLKKKKEAQDVYRELAKFEKTVKRDGLSNSVSPSSRSPTLQRLQSTGSIGTALLKPDTSDDYVKRIQKRLEEDTVARDQREKRRRRILMEQLTAHGAQEEAFREEQLINRLMRQSQQERRIAVQLMHVRHEKDILKQNRIFREKQYEERREREFREALDREAAIEKQAKLDREDEIRKVQEIHELIAAERAEARYKKHYLICQEIMSQIVDLVTKTGEYRELTNRMIPTKLMREWKELFFTGYTLYEGEPVDPLPSEPTPEQLAELEKEHLLDEKDYEEYKTMSGEWIAPEDAGVKAPATNNNVLGHVVTRLLEIVHPPEAPSPPPVFPPFPIKGCILGKLFSGKTTCVNHLAQAYSLQVLNVDILVQEAMQAYHEAETENATSSSEAGQSETEKEKLLESSSSGLSGLEVDDSITKQSEPNQPEDEGSQHQTSKMAKDEDARPKLSERAQLGGMLEKHLKKGKGAPDELLIEVIIKAIKRIPANTGWILDGFPTTVGQARLLEKSLTGTDPEKAKNRRSKASTLVQNPAGPKDSAAPSPALDFAVLVDISDNVVLQRAAEQIAQSMASAAQEGNPSKINDPDQARSQIQHRITGFHDSWHKLQMWFSDEQNILIKVNGEVEEDALRKKIEEVFLSAVVKKQNKGKETEKKVEVEPPPPPPVTPPPQETTTDPRPLSPPKQTSAKRGKGGSKSPKGSQKRSDTSKDKKEKKPDTPRGKDAGQKSPKSGTPRGRSPGKKSHSAPATPEPPEPTPVGPPPVQPGSPDWVYVDEPLPQEIPEFLLPYWETIESNYGNTIKAALKSMRQERMIVIHYLYDIRNRFKDYIKRPDHKQEFVSQWQSDFSSVPDDMREDEETKAELHQRVDDLRDRLWDICDNRKEEAEQERADIMNEGWLQDHLGILANHFITVMQAEVDRFQDTARLLHDYYQGMEGRHPSDVGQDFTRIPLLDIFGADLEGEMEQPKRIPLIPRRPQTPENLGKQKSKSAQVKSRDDQTAENTKPINETDEKLIADTWQVAVSAIANMVAHQKQAREAEEEKEQMAAETKEKERLKASQGASRGSARGSKKKTPKSPKGKRGKSPGASAPTPSPQNPEESAMLQKQQDLKFKIRQEYFFALELEEAATKFRLELIKRKAVEVCQDLTLKSQDAYRDMEMWLGARFLAEMSSIEKLIQVARHHIETSQKIQYELVLEQTEFYISSDVKVIPDPLPPPRPPPVEMSINATLTISQLNNLHQQFVKVAPKGLISKKLFTDILLDLTSMNIGKDILPDAWMYLTLPEIQEITSVLSLNSDVVDWHKFLLAASQPWPYPSVGQLLKTLNGFKAMDGNQCGLITEEDYGQVDLWFTGKNDKCVSENVAEPLPFNRLEHLIKFFYHMFADQKRQLDYTEMLLYFASHPDPKEGFYRALSVMAGKPILRTPDDNILLKSLPNMNVRPQSRGDISEDDDSLLTKPEDVTITLEQVLRVFQHVASTDGENHRFSSPQEETDNYTKSLKHIFSELCPENMEPVAVTALMKHPFFQDLADSCIQYNLPDIHGILGKSRPIQSSERESMTSNNS
ncbi:sperm flagellar protein 2 [Spea bombifrons]|uniref:sperm flagellar protein 2 n=1 Tax=Spea bombifrons TaxID=233779 RepID=UPI002349D00C|nr:sperm flagellar protein 2 [Spea bombifrons]